MTERRKPTEHLRYRNGKPSLVSEGVHYDEDKKVRRKGTSLRGGTSELAATGTGSKAAGLNLSQKYDRFPDLRSFDEAKAPYIMVDGSQKASWNGSFYILPTQNTKSWAGTLGSHQNASKQGGEK